MLQLKGVPLSGVTFDLRELERPDGALLDPRRAIGFEKNRVNILTQQGLEMLGERRVVAVGCHRSIVNAAGP